MKPQYYTIDEMLEMGRTIKRQTGKYGISWYLHPSLSTPAWALLRLASPQLPIGGYSYSQGLEWAIDSGLIVDADSAERWLADQLDVPYEQGGAPIARTGSKRCANRRLRESGYELRYPNYQKGFATVLEGFRPDDL